MSPLEKIIDQVEHLDTPTTKFVKFVIKDPEYIKAKTDKARWKEIMIISQRFSEIFKNGEYSDLRKIFKDRYPNQ